MEEEKTKEILFGFSSAREEDMISKLPDSLISHILLYLPTKEAVRTSVLSNRWKSLWLLVPGLDLNSYEFSNYNAFASFMDRCLDFYGEEKSCLHKLKLSIHKHENDNDQSCVTRWIDFVAKARKLKHLDVEWFGKRECLEVMPVSLFICETLLCLRLRQVLVGTFEESIVSLPLLKTMRLELNVYANEASLESLISSCPLLEDLSIVRRFDDNVNVLRVRSQKLASLIIKYYLVRGDNGEVDVHVANDFDLGKLGVLIDAPRLKHMTFDDEISRNKTITNSDSLTKVNILGCFFLNDSDDQVHKFFTSFSRVKDLKISFMSFQYLKDVVSLYQFCNMCCLELELSSYALENLPRLLASLPNLRSLILHLNNAWEPKRLTYVPMCLLSSLEFVEMKCYYFSGDTTTTMKLVRYFAENSVILKKLVLGLRSSTTLEEKSTILRDVLALPRRSSMCQIIVC